MKHALIRLPYPILFALCLSTTFGGCDVEPQTTQSGAVVPATLQDFGYGTMRQAGVQAPVGERPLMIVRVNGPPGTVPHTWSDQEVEDRVYNLAASINQFFERASDGMFQWKSAGIYGVWELGQHYPEMYQTLERGLQLANEHGVDFAQFDLNGDLVVDTSELGFVVLDNYSNSAGGMRAVPCVPSNGGVKVCVWGVLMGSHPSLSGLSHELTHLLGAVDLYGDSCLSHGATLMSCPTGDRYSSLDPWHRMRLGWIEPQIRGVDGYQYAADTNTTPPFVGSERPEGYVPPPGWDGSTAPLADTPLNEITPGQGGCYRLDASNSVGSRPLILYSTARGSREYFMIESRYRSGANWLFEGLSREVYIWQVRTNGHHNLYNIQSRNSEYGMDMSSFLMGHEGMRGETSPWTVADGDIALRWIDGRDSGMQVRVSDSKYDFDRVAGYHWVEVGTAGQYPAPGLVEEVELQSNAIIVRGQQLGLGDSEWSIETIGRRRPLTVSEKGCNEWIFFRPAGLSEESFADSVFYRGEERIAR